MRVSGMDFLVVSPERPAQGVRDLKRAGYGSIMLHVGAAFPQKEETLEERQRQKKYGPDTIAVRYHDYLEECRRSGMKVQLVHAPCTSIEADVPDCSEMILVSAIECMKLCRSVGCNYLIMDLPYKKEDKDLDYSRNYDFFLRIAPSARKYGVKILIKNQIKVIGDHIVRSALSEPSFAVKWVDKLNKKGCSDIFGFCLDTGRCSFCGNDMQTFVMELGDRLKAVIVSDNDGKNQFSMLPFTHPHEGQALIHWLGLIRGLRDIGFDGELVLDAVGVLSSFPRLLWPELLHITRKIADYFRWQIEMESSLKKHKKIILFGAGNMCRNYMKCYGEKYPPLFTCDNNPNLWGTSFEGIKVRNPEELRSLPPDSTVIICNMYYREIETQLRELGVENIGYFNDEYMPTFYYDRLIREAK